jgi:hypothetical protein
MLAISQPTSPTANRPDGYRLFPGQPHFFRFMVDHKVFALT